MSIMQKKYKVEGMTCSGCQKKISETLNSLDGITAEINLEKNTATMSSDQEIDLTKINSELKKAGNYSLAEMHSHNHAAVPPKDRVSPSSVYYCPMECEGDKVAEFLTMEKTNALAELCLRRGM